MMTSYDSALITVPVSSPLHPQAGQPFLKGFLMQKGFRAKIFDTNVKFFNWMLKGHEFDIKDQAYIDNPAILLTLYNRIEEALAKKACKYRGLTVDLRTIGMDYNRILFNEIIAALDDQEANPFIEFYDDFVESELKLLAPKIVGIGITFQDQIIAAFTLASCLRKKMPGVKIVLGGQMITRCYDTMLEAGTLNHLWDYLICWDGELPLLDLHEQLVNNHATTLVNVIENGKTSHGLDRGAHSFELDELSRPDFSDLDFDEYLFPEFLIPLQTARGCYGSCEFCAIPSGSNQGFRERSVEKIIDDILYVQEHTKKKYGRKATYFKFMDDTSSPRTLRLLSEQIEQRKIDAQWETFVRMEKPFENQALMEQLYRGGCRKLMWGLETNDPDILKSMDKRISPISTEKILDAAHNAGILNFCFVLIGFPGERQEQRDRLAEFIIEKESIHVLTIATFDATKRSPIQENLLLPKKFGLECEPPNDFEVRLPYTVDGKNWKKEIVVEAQRMLVKIIKERPDIGFMSLFPDQVRGILTERHGNTWGRKCLTEFGKENIQSLLLSTEHYIDAFENAEEFDLAGLPEPIKREHQRIREDIKAIALAIGRRKKYETKRVDSI